jgi:hypothetical protein
MTRPLLLATVLAVALLLAMGLGPGGVAQAACASCGPVVRQIRVRVDIPARLGLSWGCVSLTGNPLGYYIEHHVVTGYNNQYANGVTESALYADYRGRGVAGPAHVTGQYSYVACGLP